MYFQPLPIHMNHLYIYHLESIRSWFGKRGYPKKLVDNQLRRVVENRPEQLPEHQKNPKKTRNWCATCGYIPFSVS